MQSSTSSIPARNGNLESGKGAGSREEVVLIGDRRIVGQGARVGASGVLAGSRIHIGQSDHVVVGDGSD